MIKRTAYRSAIVTIDKWSPALQIRTVLLSIQALLSAPNPDDPLATDVAKHYKENEPDAQRVSKEWTEKYASSWAIFPCTRQPRFLVGWAYVALYTLRKCQKIYIDSVNHWTVVTHVVSQCSVTILAPAMSPSFELTITTWKTLLPFLLQISRPERGVYLDLPRDQWPHTRKQNPDFCIDIHQVSRIWNYRECHLL